MVSKHLVIIVTMIKAEKKVSINPQYPVKYISSLNKTKRTQRRRRSKDSAVYSSLQAYTGRLSASGNGTTSTLDTNGEGDSGIQEVQLVMDLFHSYKGNIYFPPSHVSHLPLSVSVT